MSCFRFGRCCVCRGTARLRSCLALDPSRAKSEVPLWGQTGLVLSSLSPKRVSGTAALKRLNSIPGMYLVCISSRAETGTDTGCAGRGRADGTGQ